MKTLLLKPFPNINNYIQNMQPLTLDYLREQSSNLTLEHVQKIGICRIRISLKERVACVDYARRKLKFKDKDGNLI